MKLALSILLAGLLIAPVLTRAQPLAVAWQTMHPAEMEAVRYLEIQFAGQKFTLVPPVGCRVNTELHTASVQLSSSTGSVSMTIQFSTNNPRWILTSRDTLQQYAAPQGAETEVHEEFPAYSNAAAGKGIELGFNLHGQPMRRRAAVVPFSGGHTGFIVTSVEGESKAAQQLFGGVLTSFQQASGTASR